MKKNISVKFILLFLTFLISFNFTENNAFCAEATTKDKLINNNYESLKIDPGKITNEIPKVNLDREALSILKDNFLSDLSMAVSPLPPKEKTVKGCSPLSQEFLDGFNTSIDLSEWPDGCVELVEDVHFDHNIIIDNHLIFEGNGYKLSSFFFPVDSAVHAFGESKIFDIQLSNKNIVLWDNALADHVNYLYANGAIHLYGQSKAENCLVNRQPYNEPHYAYLLSDNSIVENSVSTRSNFGFILNNTAKVINCEASLHYVGFKLNDNSYVENSQSYSNYAWGFFISSESSAWIKDCLAKNNPGYYISAGYPGTTPKIENSKAENSATGFYVAQDPSWTSGISAQIINCETENSFFGFHIKGPALVQGSTAKTAQQGFRIAEGSQGTIVNSKAINNAQVGFYLEDSSATNCQSLGNAVGFYLENNASATNCKSAFNEYGFKTKDSATIINAYSTKNIFGLKTVGSVTSPFALIEGGVFCHNEESNMSVDFAQIEGFIRTYPIPPPDINVHVGNPTFGACIQNNIATCSWTDQHPECETHYVNGYPVGCSSATLTYKPYCESVQGFQSSWECQAKEGFCSDNPDSFSCNSKNSLYDYGPFCEWKVNSHMLIHQMENSR